MGGLILEMLHGYKAAAGPPTFATVTRDNLPSCVPPGPGPRYTPASAVAIARSVAAGAAKLHASGVMHGDIYLHNTLVKWKGSFDAFGRRGCFRYRGCPIEKARCAQFWLVGAGP